MRFTLPGPRWQRRDLGNSRQAPLLARHRETLPKRAGAISQRVTYPIVLEWRRSPAQRFPAWWIDQRDRLPAYGVSFARSGIDAIVDAAERLAKEQSPTTQAARPHTWPTTTTTHTTRRCSTISPRRSRSRRPAGAGALPARSSTSLRPSTGEKDGVCPPDPGWRTHTPSASERSTLRQARRSIGASVRVIASTRSLVPTTSKEVSHGVGGGRETAGERSLGAGSS